MSLLKSIVKLTREAGEVILKHYKEPFTEVERKEDHSPLTQADRESNALLVEGLKNLHSSPILAEESEQVPYETRKDWESFWLVDPLDGTREFIKKNGEFSVCVALVEKGRPTLGVIHIPVSNTTYFAQEGQGAWKQEEEGEPQPIHSNAVTARDALTVLSSRSHPSPQTQSFLQDYKIKESINVGSAIKFCWMAEGRADLYPRFVPTMEWDVAAGDILYRESSQGRVSWTPFEYNKPSLKNGSFVLAPFFDQTTYPDLSRY